MVIVDFLDLDSDHAWRAAVELLTIPGFATWQAQIEKLIKEHRPWLSMP